MTNKYKISKIIEIKTHSKAGVQFMTKKGIPFRKADINVEGDKRKITYCIWQGKEIEVGMEIVGEIAEREWNDMKFYDFKEETEKKKILTETEGLKTKVSKLEFKQNQIIDFLRTKFPTDEKLKGLNSAGLPVPNFTPNTPAQQEEYRTKMADYEEIVYPEDIPF